MVVIAIIAIMAAAVVPRLGVRPLQRRKQLAVDIAAIIGLGWQQALMTNKIHRVTLDFKERLFSLQVDEGAMAGAKDAFKDIKSNYFISTEKLPENFEIKQFFIEGKDEMQRSAKGLTTAYFLIVPEGLVQSVIMNIVDKNDLDAQGRAFKFGLVVNPFSGQCTYYDSFQKP
jgi:type II secretory pathway pseudopilin PulG